ncbi:MAG: glycosyltransferase family 4 protein [Melioribacteraceae bacterium]
MKILHLHIELNKTCGITKTILVLAKNSQKEIQHNVFTLSGDNINLFTKNGISVQLVNGNRNSLLDSLRIFYKLFHYCKKEKIDILHAHHRYFDFLSFMLGKFLKIKKVTSVQSKVYGQKLFSYKSPKLVAVSNSIKNHLMQNYYIEENRITLINNFVEDNDETSLSQNNDLLIPQDQKIILFVGRFSRDKGVDILLQAFRLLQKNDEKIFLVMIGAGEEELFLKSFIAENKLNALILVPQEDVNRYYKSADIIILPSRVDPFPLVMLESGMMAKPFIGGDVDGIGEFIEHDQNGLLVEPGNVKELAAAINKLLDDPVKASYLGRNLYEKVKLNCSAEIIIPKYLELYKEVLADG